MINFDDLGFMNAYKSLLSFGVSKSITFLHYHCDKEVSRVDVSWLLGWVMVNGKPL
jgi:hypothetical protein